MFKYRIMDNDIYFGVNFASASIELFNPEKQRWYGDCEGLRINAFLNGEWEIQWDGRSYHRMDTREIETFVKIAKFLINPSTRVLYGKT